MTVCRAALFRLVGLTVTAWLFPFAVLAQPTPADGVYKKLTYIPEAGDLLGMAVEIREHARRIIVTVCEGGCGGGRETDLHATPAGFTFATCEPFRKQDGKTGPCDKVRYSGTVLRDGRLAIMVAGEPKSRIILRKVRKPKANEVRDLGCMDHC